MATRLSQNIQEQQQVKPIELRSFVGLSLKIDSVNRPPNSWQQLDDCDLFIEGSVRNVFGWAKFGANQLGAPYEAIFEYRLNDNAPRQIWGYCGTRGTLERLDVNATPISLATAFPAGITPWIGMLPGTNAGFTFKRWTKTTAYTLGDAVTKKTPDGDQYIFAVGVPGTSGSTEPTWPTSASVVDAGVTWVNEGKYDDFVANFSVIAGEGGPLQKFDGSTVTRVGISAPTIQAAILSSINTTFAARGIAIQFGRIYAWTWFNPRTLIESSPSPLTGLVTFFANDLGGIISQPGCVLGPTPGGQFYGSVLLGLPPNVTTPIVGDGFTHVRFYATRDGGTVLFLIPTLYDSVGNILTDANSAVKITDLLNVSGYIPSATTQSKVTMRAAYDGSPSGVYAGIKDSIPSGDDGSIQGWTPSAVLPQSPGILPSDPDSSALFDGFSGYISTPQAVPAADIQSISIFGTFRSTNTAGGPIVFMSDTSVGTTGGASNCYVFIANGGNLVLGYWNGSHWKTIVASGNYADGNTHDFMVISNHPAPATSLYADGTLVATVAEPIGTGVPIFWRIGGNGKTDSTAFATHRSASEYFSGAIAKIAVWHDTVLTGTNAANLHTAAGNGTLTVSIYNILSPTHFWALDDVGSPTSITNETSLVLPGPTLGENDPPPENPNWAAIYSGSLYVTDAEDRAKIWYSNAGEFETFGIDNFLVCPSRTDAPITSLINAVDKLIISTTRGLQQVLGSSPMDFQRLPVDEYHGFVGKQLAIASGSQLIGLIKQGIVGIDISLSFQRETGQDHVSVGFSPFSLIGNDVQPITKALDPTGFSDIDMAIYDTTANRVLFLLRTPNAPAGLADELLVYQLQGGFSRIVGIPGGALRSIAECVIGDETSLGILASDAQGQIWQLLTDPEVDQSATIAPQCQTQALPSIDQVGVELRDTEKVFRYVWVEGVGQGDWLLDWSVDGGASFRPTPRLPLVPGRNGIGDQGTQIALRFTRNPNAQPSESRFSYMKVDWDIAGRTQQT